MDRRSLLVGAATLVSWPRLASAADTGRVARIGYLSLNQAAGMQEAMARRLADFGWIPGRTLKVEVRHADGVPDRLEALARELVDAGVDVIVASGVRAVLAAKRATTRIPIVIAGASDPIAFGLVESLAHPGGNVTGVADSPGRDLEGKRLELLKTLVPTATKVAIILDSSGRRDPLPIVGASTALGLVPLLSPETVTPDDFRRTFVALRRDGAQALYAPETPVNAQHRELIVSLAAQHRLPAMYGSREFVDAGGLMAYGVSYTELHRRAAEYIHRILSGAKPRELPVEQPTRLELALNLDTAEALKLAVPPALLLRTDHVVQGRTGVKR
jgi:putative ABC transport system substrate-binding protein